MLSIRQEESLGQSFLQRGLPQVIVMFGQLAQLDPQLTRWISEFDRMSLDLHYGNGFKHVGLAS
jgi:hypothetical protein